jgi:hypothetical protein
MTSHVPDLADVEPAPKYGPALAALSEKRRAFVFALFDAPKTIGRLTWAARAAGYGTPTSSLDSIRTIGSRLAQDEQVQKAIAEESHRRLRSLAPAALTALNKLIESPKHKDHARGLAMILERTDPIESTHHVKVERVERPSIAATEAVLKRIADLARRAGLSPQLMPPVIDADFQVVEDVG